MKKSIESLYGELRERYPYVSVDKKVVEQFVRNYKSHSVHLLYDYILSQGLEDDVEI